MVRKGTHVVQPLNFLPFIYIWLYKKSTQHKEPTPLRETIKAGSVRAIHDQQETLGDFRPGGQLATPR